MVSAPLNDCLARWLGGWQDGWLGNTVVCLCLLSAGSVDPSILLFLSASLLKSPAAHPPLHPAGESPGSSALPSLCLS